MYLNNDKQAKATLCKYGCGKMLYWYTDKYGKPHCYEKRDEPNTWHYCGKDMKAISRSMSPLNREDSVSLKQTVSSYPKVEFEVERESRRVWTYAYGNVIAVPRDEERLSGKDVQIKRFLEGTIRQTVGKITLRGLLQYHYEIEFFDVWLPTNKIAAAHIKHGVEFDSRINSTSTIQGKRIWLQA